MTRQIDSDAVINSVRLKETTVPATPAAGYRNLYVKTTGLFLIDDVGNEYQISPDVDGTAYQILRMNAAANGVEYASVGRVLISEQTPTGTGTVTWDAIPATYNSLEIELIARGTQVATSTGLNLYFNNDTTAGNYRRWGVSGDGSTPASAAGDDAIIANISAASATAAYADMAHIYIFNYAATVFNKLAQVINSRRDAATTNAVAVTGFQWESAAAITRVDLVLASGNYDTGSTFRLYGVY